MTELDLTLTHCERTLLSAIASHKDPHFAKTEEGSYAFDQLQDFAAGWDPWGVHIDHASQRHARKLLNAIQTGKDI